MDPKNKIILSISYLKHKDQTIIYLIRRISRKHFRYFTDGT